MTPGRPLSRRSVLAAGLALAVPAALAGCTVPAPAGMPPPRTPAPRRAGTGAYQAVDGYLYAPDGSLFTPVGANVGVAGAFDWKGDCRGHAADALAWGWNTVRLTIAVTAGHSWSYVAQRSQAELLALTRQVVEEYTGAGIVVILDAHDDPTGDGLDRAQMEADMAQWWRLAAAAFADNPRVWHGLINEPDYLNDEWLQLLDRLAGAVRETGNEAPVLLGAPGWGQDLGYTGPYFTDARFSYESTMAPVLADRYGNVILEQHNYGAYGSYSSVADFTGYVERVRAAGLTPLIGEFGYTTARDITPDVYDANYESAQAVLQVARPQHLGALWWHGTHGDGYSLLADGGPFWKGRDGAGLSDGGRRFWEFTHPG